MQIVAASPPGAGEAVGTRIASTSTAITNKEAVGRMLLGLRHADGIRKNLSHAILVRQWHEDTERSYWVASDGATALCLTVSGLTADETATIGKSFDERRAHRPCELSACSMRDLIEAELDVIVELVN